jgi:arginine/lysine/ornithine decarboxylase
MLTPENTKLDLERLVTGFGKNYHVYEEKEYLSLTSTKQVMSIREAMFSIPETVMLAESENRICRVPTISCPPAIPIAVPGELITKELISIFEYYGITELDVVKRLESR